MSFSIAQQQVNDWVSQYKIGYFPPGFLIGQMAEEVGEVAKVVSYIEGIKKAKHGESLEDLGAELADVMFAIMCMANAYKIDLDTYRTSMIEDKLGKRDVARFEKK